MIINTIVQRALPWLRRIAGHRQYPVLVGCAALAATASMSVPFGPLLVPAVLLRPERWARLALFSALGCALGGTLLYLAFARLGWQQFAAAYPDILATPAWRQSAQWLGAYGIPALPLIALLPMPLSPAIAFAALGDLPLAQVFAALLLGKWIKHCIYAWLVSRFPQRFLRRRKTSKA
jgi:membrane protein YqaA with SNARE-associated domain